MQHWKQTSKLMALLHSPNAALAPESTCIAAVATFQADCIQALWLKHESVRWNSGFEGLRKMHLVLARVEEALHLGQG